jgi:anthranilate phosphoribosyltransferase
MVDVYGAVFAELGRKRAWAVHGEMAHSGGLDEMSTLGATQVCKVEGGRLSRDRVDAADFGLRRPELAELLGGSGAENATRLEALLRGRLPGAIEDMVVWNTAGALVVAGRVADLGAGIDCAREALRSGEAAARLDALRAATAAS